LQSHGITGVQATYYDGYDYLDEKRESMELLHRLLTKPPGTVVKFPKVNRA
jgi:predicted dienelactone hydrolase